MPARESSAGVVRRQNEKARVDADRGREEAACEKASEERHRVVGELRRQNEKARVDADRCVRTAPVVVVRGCPELLERSCSTECSWLFEECWREPSDDRVCAAAKLGAILAATRPKPAASTGTTEPKGSPIFFSFSFHLGIVCIWCVRPRPLV